MSTKVTKLLSLFLVVFLLVAVAAGCGKTADTSKDTSDNEPVQQDSSTGDTPDETGDEPDVEEPTFDLEGRTITYGAWWDLAPVEGSSEHSDNLIKRIADMEEKYNFKFEFKNIPWDQYVEQFPASIMAGDPIVDIAIVEDGHYFPGYVTRGYLYPLSDLSVFDFSEDKWNKDYMKFTTYEGKVYGMSEYRTDPRSNIYWNKTIFEREGLPNLYELQYTDEWTWDKMLEIAQKATKDLDGDGKVDQWGLGGMGTEWGLVYSNGGEAIKMDGTTPVFALSEPKALEGLQFFQDLIHVYKVFELPPEGAAWDYPAQQFQDGKYAMYHGYWWQAPVQFQANMQDEYGFVLVPKGPNAGDNYASPLSGVNFAVMPMNVENPEAVATIFDEYTDPFPGDDPEAWKEGYLAGFRDKESVDTVEYMMTSGIFKQNLINCFSDVGNLTGSVIWQLTHGDKTAKVAVEEIAQQAQASIDDTMSETEGIEVNK